MQAAGGRLPSLALRACWLTPPCVALPAWLGAASKAAAASYDYTGETLYFESGPHAGDVAVNVALGATLIWLPLSLAAVGGCWPGGRRRRCAAASAALASLC